MKWGKVAVVLAGFGVVCSVFGGAGKGEVQGDNMRGLLALHGLVSGDDVKVGVGVRYRVGVVGNVVLDKSRLMIGDTGTLHLGGEVFRLKGLDLVGGHLGRIGLGKILDGRRVRCEFSGGELDREGVCILEDGGKDVGGLLVSAGWGVGKGKNYAVEMKGARDLKVGVWGN